jgi:hypothetical protein
MAQTRSLEDGWIQELQKDIAEIKSISIGNRDALLGKLDQPGILTKLALMNTRLDNMETLTSNHLAHLTERFDMMLASRDLLQGVKDKNQINWADIAKDWVMPILQAITTAILLYFIVQNGIAK